MRITFVIASLEAGGAERVLVTMANYWATRGWCVAVLTLGPQSSDFYPLDPKVIRIGLDMLAHSRNLMSGIFNNLNRIVRLRAAISSTRPDLVISFVDKINVITLIATRGLGIPVIVSERVDPSRHHIGSGWSWMRRLAYRWAAAVVVQSERIRNELCRIIAGAPNIEVIPNAVTVPIEVSARQFKAIEDTRGGKIVVGVGRLVKQKGFDLLLEAFGRIAWRHQAWRLMIVGTGPEASQLQQEVQRLGLEQTVQVVGLLPNVTEVLCRSSLFVMSSRFEGFPNALLEAMACGLPVISFDCPSGPAEIIRDGVDGILVPPEDVSALANAMDRLMRDETERVRLGAEARNVCIRFALDEIMKRWTTLVIASTQRGPRTDFSPHE